MKLFFSALSKFILGLLLSGALLFIPAGTLRFPNAYLFLALLFAPVLILGAILFIKKPELLRKRLDAREKEQGQKKIVSLSAFIFLVGFTVAGLDFRFNWSIVPRPAVAFASAVLLISYALYAEVMRENTYLSRTVKVESGQKVIDRGLYSVVRHPMYASTISLFLAVPVVLGSWWSLLVFASYVPVIALRILGEEKILEKELGGYTEYKKRVKYRLFPLVW